MLEQLGSLFRKLSAILCLVGVMVTFYTLLGHIPLDRFNKPKPPLLVQLLPVRGRVHVGLPGVVSGRHAG